MRRPRSPPGGSADDHAREGPARAHRPCGRRRRRAPRSRRAVRGPPGTAPAHLPLPRRASRTREGPRLHRARPARARLGQGGLLLVTGEAGAGKTRLAKEIGRRAMRVQIRVIASDCARSLQGTAPLQGFRGLFEAISDRCRERGHDEALRLLGGNASIVAPYDSGLLRLTESLQMPRAAPLAPDAARLRLFRSLAEVLKAFAKLGPLVLLVDDLQEADELTPAALDYLARSGVLADCPALVVACYRSEEASTDVQRIKNAPGAREVVAERLDPAAIAAIVSDMLALPDLPDPFARFLERTAEGNPFFVAQYLRTAVLEGILVRDGSGQWRMRTVDSSQAQPLVEALPLPTSLHELISRRLLGISGTARDVVDTASVLGREVDPDLLQAVTGLPEDALEEAIDELVRRHCLQRSGSRLLFRHASLRDLAYASIEETRRASCHRRAAEHLEARAGGSDALLGRHWERAGETANARSCYRVAMLAAHDRFANREAEELARAYLALTPEPTVESVAVRSTLGDALRLQGKTALALAEQARTLDEARSLGDRGIEAHAENALAGLEHVMGNPEKARARYESALRTCRQLGDTRLQATILENLALLHGNQGDGDAAEALHREVLAMHRAAGNHRGAVVVMSNYGGFLQEQGRLEPALAILREALPLAEKDGERDMLGNIHGNQGAIYEARGELRQAQEGYERALAIHRSIGSRLAEGISLANLAHVASHRGSTKDGLAYARDARRIAAEVQALRLRAFVAAVEGSLSMADGDAATARARFDEAVELATDRHPYFAAMALRGMARLDAQEGDIDGALASGARSLELARQVDDKRGEAAIVVTLATVCRRAGLDKPDAGELANAESTLRRAGDALGLALCLCERGHRAIARGEPAAAQLAEAETIAQAAGLEAGASLASRVAALRRAIHRAQSERGALSAGECPEDYPPRLLAAISRAPRRPDGNDDTRAAPSRG
ncbi:MAG: tetratricopeptide repeat protein [Acidobacteriota bacterium]